MLWHQSISCLQSFYFNLFNIHDVRAIRTDIIRDIKTVTTVTAKGIVALRTSEHYPEPHIILAATMTFHSFTRYLLTANLMASDLQRKFLSSFTMRSRLINCIGVRRTCVTEGYITVIFYHYPKKHPYMVHKYLQHYKYSHVPHNTNLHCLKTSFYISFSHLIFLTRT